jgi:hypothetical protein
VASQTVGRGGGELLYKARRARLLHNMKEGKATIIVIESYSSDQNLGFCKFPLNPNRGSRYIEALKLAGEIMEPLDFSFYFLQGPTLCCFCYPVITD